jgi:4-hydroxy-tetrahydrodipicolinate reductase
MSATPVKVGIIGIGGRMGQAIAAVLADDARAKLIGGVEKEKTPNAGVLITDDIGELAPKVDLLIDFSSPALTVKAAQAAAHCGIAYFVGTTGLDDEAKKALTAASEKIPVLQASNTSLSLVVMKKLAQMAAGLLKDYDYDVAIWDAHHRMKKDAPSGTALTLGEWVLKGNGGKKQPTYASTRAGFIIGEHEVLFAGPGETIALRHQVTDRTVFARGAVTGGLWLVEQKPGLYSMDEVLGI